MRIVSMLVFTTLVSLAGPAALAQETPASPPKPVNVDDQQLALQGYDPVEYFTSKRAQVGKAQYTATHQNATYRFVSSKNRDMFVAAPEKYAPQYGGYCAWAVSHGYTAPVDPKVFAVVDQKLYLNYDASVMEDWQKDRKNLIEQANRNWPKLVDKKR